MKDIAETRVRYGYRSIHVLLRRESRDVNAKRIYRLHNEMGLQLRHKPPKRRAKAKLREGRGAASCSNEVWAMDFVHVQLVTGPKLRILTVIDTFSRFSPAVVPRFSFRAPDVVKVLERVCGEVGYPASTKAASSSHATWTYGPNARRVTLDFSRPGKPTDNAFVKSFNGRLRDECLNAHWFLSMTDARAKIEAWRRDYTESRPHTLLGRMTPVEYAAAAAAKVAE